MAAKTSRRSQRRPQRSSAIRKKVSRKSVKTKKRRDPETLRLRTLQAALTVGDLDRSIRFYTDALGFIIGERWTTSAGVLRGVRLTAGVCNLNLTQDDWAKGRDRRKGEGLRLWCKTAQDIDALAVRIKGAGGLLTEEPMTQPWGGRSLSVDDPDGFHLTIFREP